MGRGYALASQEIRGKVARGDIIVAERDLSLLQPSDLTEPDRHKAGWFADEQLEKRVQPSSMDFTLGDVIFWIDTDRVGNFRPSPTEQVYTLISKIPNRFKQRIDLVKHMASGYPLMTQRRGKYALPLVERVRLATDESMKNSTKSSLGRIFLDGKGAADYNPSMDEIKGHYRPGAFLQTWLFVEPQVIDPAIRPGDTLNQMRFFKGLGAKLSAREMLELFEESPYMFEKVGDEYRPINIGNYVDEEGIQMHTDIDGDLLKGIRALRAKPGRDPLDLRKIGQIPIEEYFDFVVKPDEVRLQPGDCHLVVSHEHFKVPARISVEVQQYNHIGVRGPLHFAGFVDNGFEGPIVMEHRYDDRSMDTITSKMPISKVMMYRTRVTPDKIYGTQIGSNYQFQQGVKIAKFFIMPDLDKIVRQHERLKAKVLVQDTRQLLKHRLPPESQLSFRIPRARAGFEPVNEEQIKELFDIMHDGFYQVRYDCEEDESVLQVVPYVLLFQLKNDSKRTISKDRIFTYTRASDQKLYGDTRLFGKTSFGVGGHIFEEDAKGRGTNELILHSMLAKVNDEVEVGDLLHEPVLVGTLMEYDKPVDRVHFGLVYAARTRSAPVPKAKSIVYSTMAPVDRFTSSGISSWYSPDMAAASGAKRPLEEGPDFETWTRSLIPFLPYIRDLARGGKKVF